MSLDKLLGILNKAEVEVTDDLKSDIIDTWNEALAEAKPDDDLLTQEEVNNIVKKRLARERETYESELKELRNKMENLVEPEQVDSVKEQFESQVDNLKQKTNETTKEYELRLAAVKNGAKDEDYIVYQAEKRGIKDKLGFDDNGNIIIVDDEGNPEKDEEGNIKTTSHLISEMKEEMPIHFSDNQEEETNKSRKSAGATNPKGGDYEPSKDKKIEKSKEMAASMGYKPKDKEE